MSFFFFSFFSTQLSPETTFWIHVPLMCCLSLCPPTCRPPLCPPKGCVRFLSRPGSTVPFHHPHIQSGPKRSTFPFRRCPDKAVFPLPPHPSNALFLAQFIQCPPRSTCSFHPLHFDGSPRPAGAPCISRLFLSFSFFSLSRVSTCRGFGKRRSCRGANFLLI